MQDNEAITNSGVEETEAPIENLPDDNQTIPEQTEELVEVKDESGLKKRLKRQKSKHERELAARDQLINDLRAQVMQQGEQPAFQAQPESIPAEPSDLVSQIRQAIAQERVAQQNKEQELLQQQQQQGKKTETNISSISRIKDL